MRKVNFTSHINCLIAVSSEGLRTILLCQFIGYLFLKKDCTSLLTVPVKLKRIFVIDFCFQPSMADNLLPVVVEGFIKNELESDEEILTEIHHPQYSESCQEETANLRYCAKRIFFLPN